LTCARGKGIERFTKKSPPPVYGLGVVFIRNYKKNPGGI